MLEFFLIWCVHHEFFPYHKSQHKNMLILYVVYMMLSEENVLKNWKHKITSFELFKPIISRFIHLGCIDNMMCSRPLPIRHQLRFICFLTLKRFSVMNNTEWCYDCWGNKIGKRGLWEWFADMFQNILWMWLTFVADGNFS